jgi:hypothetical protein
MCSFTFLYKTYYVKHFIKGNSNITFTSNVTQFTFVLVHQHKLFSLTPLSRYNIAKNHLLLLKSPRRHRGTGVGMVYRNLTLTEGEGKAPYIRTGKPLRSSVTGIKEAI